MKLYEIAHEYRAIMAQVEAADGELTGIEYALDDVQEQMSDKCAAICTIIREHEALADMRRNEAKRLTVAAQRDETTVERLKAYLAANVPADGIQAGVFTVGFRTSKAVELDALDMADMRDLSEHFPDFYRTEISVKPDKTAIKKAIESGETITGARLVVRQNISIK